MLEYTFWVNPETAQGPRWELYRLLAEPVRLRVLALAGVEELAIGELAELLGEAQPNVSKHVKPLRHAALLSMRKQGTRALVRLAEGAGRDAVVADALRAGRALCQADGSLGRVVDVVRGRDQAAREFFDAPGAAPPVDRFPTELPAYLTALAPLVSQRRLAVDVGTGEGSLLDVLAPIFEQVVAIDRSQTQLERATARMAHRGYQNVRLLQADYDDETFQAEVQGLGGADAVFVSRVLHHAPRPAAALATLAELARPGGAIVVVDYAAHQDERMREHQADLWLGFDPDEIRDFAAQAGLSDAACHPIPANRCGAGPDGHLNWQVLVARRS